MRLPEDFLKPTRWVVLDNQHDSAQDPQPFRDISAPAEPTVRLWGSAELQGSFDDLTVLMTVVWEGYCEGDQFRLDDLAVEPDPPELDLSGQDVASLLRAMALFEDQQLGCKPLDEPVVGRYQINTGVRKMRKTAQWSPEKVAEEFSLDQDLAAAVFEMAKEEDIDLDMADVEDNYWGWPVDGVAHVEDGNREYGVARDYETANSLAVQMVMEQLEEEPELFTPSWLANFINLDRLRRNLAYDVQNMNEEDIGYDIEQGKNLDLWAEEAGLDPDDFDDEEALQEALKGEVEEIAELRTRDQLRDPLEYLEEIYGDEATKKAMEISGVDIAAAADDAVNVDGPGHFLAGYDGELRELSGPGVYWRHN